MSNRKFNFNEKKPEVYHKFQASPGEYCDALVEDFFAVVEGRVDDLKLIVVKDKIPENPTIDQMATIMAACNNKWRSYCSWYNLPGESTRLFTKKVARKWTEKIVSSRSQNTGQSRTARKERQKRTRN